MNTVNPSALLRSLIVYAICVPLAIFVGYMLTSLANFDQGSIIWIGVVLAILIFPLLMKWHYPLLVFSCALPVTLFFIPGHPNVFLAMVAISLTVSVVERILDRNKRFMSPSGVQWPFIAFLIVILITAKLTGGFGLRAMGSEVYGGKKYVFLVVGILSFFALIAQPIPKKHANLYISLFFLGGVFNAVSDLYAFAPSSLQFIFWLIPPSTDGMDAWGNQQIVFGETRLGGIAAAAGAVIFWMLSRHGFRGNFITNKLWRPLLFVLMMALVFLGGFRSSILGVVAIVSLLFYLEKMHRTGVMFVVILVGILGAALLVPMARHLPYTFQRALAFLPLDISTEARMDAEGSTEWRLEMWSALLPEVPKYLLLGKGYAFSAETFDESMGANATFHNQKIIDASQDPLALSNDFHSGPLSTIIVFGIWGGVILLWLWGVGFFVVWRNYRYGDPALWHINLFLFASFITNIFFFLFIFGDIVNDTTHFASTLGLSIALNHGVARRRHPVQQTTVPAQKRGIAHGSMLPGPALPALSR